MNYKYKRADLNDLDRINHLINNEDFLITNNDFINENINYIYILIDENIVIGLIKYKILYENSELEYIYVNDKYRSQRLGSYMLNNMIDNCYKNGCTNITLEVNILNIVAINAYKKFNFNKVAVRKGYYHGVDALLMERKLV